LHHDEDTLDPGGSFLRLLDVPHLGCQIVATPRGAEQERTPVIRLRLQMLAPLSTR
jgi:hypothetical protein